MSKPSAPAATVGGRSDPAPPDERLAIQASRRDRRALTAIYRRYHQRLYRYCLAIVGNPEDAQDALQNTMLKVLRALPGEQRSLKLKPWLYRIAHNESIEILRSRRETAAVDPELAAPGPDPAAQMEASERLRLLVEDLRELPERQRGTLTMRELGGLDFDEIGVALGCSAQTARQTLYEARLALRQIADGREMSCDEVTRLISDGDRRTVRRRRVRAHLRSCPACAAFASDVARRTEDLALLAPLPAAASAALLHGVIGSGAAASGAGTAVGGLGAGAAKTVGAATAIKSAAAITAIAVVGVSAADRSGLVHIAPRHDRDSGGALESAPTRSPASGMRSGRAAVDASHAAGARPAPGRRVAAGRIGVGKAATGATGQPTKQSRGISALPGSAARGQGKSAAAAAHRNGQSPGQGKAKGRGRGSGNANSAGNHRGRSQAQVTHSKRSHAAAAQGGSASPVHPAHPSHPATPPAGQQQTPPPQGQAGQTPQSQQAEHGATAAAGRATPAGAVGDPGSS